MNTCLNTTGGLARTIRRQRLTIAGLGGILVLLLAGGQAQMAGWEAEPSEEPARAQYVAGGDRLYRIHPGGKIEYILVDFSQGTVEGIPGWAPLEVDETLTRDRMGNTMRLPRR